MNYKIGHGYDLHRLQPGGQLFLAGILVSSEISPISHSDGDVVLHAIVDALLGALALGDIGDHFPNSDPQWKSAKSEIFLTHAYSLATSAGWKLENLDITILAERPTLKPFKPAMKSNLAKLLHCDPSQINLKAGTNESCDSIGRGESLAAHAILLLTRS
ncbi:MAG TPA: 2-C-methyl-D-erythritol 2,4-cyclodiphosphate synthase [Tepidisphaeraceae bacterium]|nr:2-C-methyl-D-erythritol 2,4-cyclodiphosphate synthase [Tepidisphaeraceae bacterium]